MHGKDRTISTADMEMLVVVYRLVLATTDEVGAHRYGLRDSRTQRRNTVSVLKRLMDAGLVKQEEFPTYVLWSLTDPGGSAVCKYFDETDPQEGGR